MDEALQWLAIAVLGLGVIAAYRQLGLWVIGSRALFEETFGPAIGDLAPSRYADLFGNLGKGEEEWTVSRYIAIFVNPECPICEEIVNHLKSERARGQLRQEGAVVGLVAQDEAHLLSLRERLPWISTDVIRRLYPKGDVPGGYPFFIEFDSSLRVRNKKLGTNGLDLLFGSSDRAVRSSSQSDV